MSEGERRTLGRLQTKESPQGTDLHLSPWPVEVRGVATLRLLTKKISQFCSSVWICYVSSPR